MKEVLSGNEAVARGAWEAGVKFAAAYPGTPSTEILENCARYDEIDAQWSTNEKVALEVAMGASLGGVRALAAQKHVGLNVAADPFFNSSYLGVGGGLVIITCDDPGMHSSQNEQDNRHYARHAKMPCIEPSDSQESKDLIIKALEISEEFDTPVLFRMTTRTCHSKSVVELGDRREVPKKELVRDMSKVVLPSVAKKLHSKVEKRSLALEDYASSFEWNRSEIRSEEIGVICHGVTYNYVREQMPEASTLKITFSWPLPRKLVREFTEKVKKVVVCEELDPIMEEQIRAMGIPVEGKRFFSIEGEMTPEKVARGLSEAFPEAFPQERIPEEDGAELDIVRPPVMCPGCTHRGVFHALGRMKDVFVAGDIGCYTLGAYAPLNAMHSCVCMGAGVSLVQGLEKAGNDHRKVVGIVGDSTFAHSGITGLVDAVYNGACSTLIILDNDITAMTGHQQNPTTGSTLKGEKRPKLDIEGICKACGVEHVKVVDPYDLTATKKALQEELDRPEYSVLIFRRPCALLGKMDPDRPKLEYHQDKCIACGKCFSIGCPVLEREQLEGKKKRPKVNWPLCVHCGLCAQICPMGALEMVKK